MRDYYLSIIFGQRQTWDAVLVRGILSLFSWVYAGIVMLWRWLYQRNIVRSYNLGRPVISVGNITWGGVGKTPIVAWIAKEARGFKKNPVILMRGYMPKDNSGVAASDEKKILSDLFDGEVPVIAQKDRVQGALSVPEGYQHDLFLLDDGFQHWRVKRSVDIVVIDALNPFGNGKVLPRGILREPLKALRNADIVMISRVDLGENNLEMIREKIDHYASNATVAECCHQPVEFLDLKTKASNGLDSMERASAVLVSGIGNPKGFELTVEKLGVDVKHHIVFPDHHSYTSSDAEKIAYQLERYEGSQLIITAKDAVKLEPFIDMFSEATRLLVLLVEIKIIKGEEELRHAICVACDH